MAPFTEVPDSNVPFKDTEFIASSQHVSDQWVSIRELYPGGAGQPLLPDTFSRDQFGQGNHYECFMLSALATLVRFPDAIRRCFVSKKVRKDGRYTFQFFRGGEWVKVEIDDTIPLEDDDVLYTQSPTEHWWPLLLEKAYAKFYTSYDHLEGCTLLEAFHDLTGHPVLNIPMQVKLAKSAGVDIEDGQYWLAMGECLQRGDYVSSALTKNTELEAMGMQSEQQYAMLAIFSLTGSSALDDIVVHLHNPFEDDEFGYSGPLNKNDSKWTAKQRQQYPVDDRHSIFIPLRTFLKHTNSIQYCFMSTVNDEPQLYSASWKGRSAGGNPTFVSWRENPLFLIRNAGETDVKYVSIIQQVDQRRTADPEKGTSYVQCGMVVSRSTYPNPIPTFWVTGNNHKTIFKSLFLNSREVANTITIPAQSTCYLVPSCMQRGIEGQFKLLLYHFKDQNYAQLSVERLAIPQIDWANPAKEDVQLQQKEKERVDFYVDEASDVHILMHQTKPYVRKSGGDAMTEDYMGMYLYDDTDRRVNGVHAATNFREISIIHHVPRSGRYAISITCPRANSEVPAYVTVVATPAAHARIVEAPEDAGMFDDEDVIDEGEEEAVANPIDYTPIELPVNEVVAVEDSSMPYEDKRFYMDNRDATSEPWVHIGDLYPEGKTKPLLPEQLSRDQFEQGDHYNCSTLTGFAAMVERHPDVIRNCFISKKPRKDGRYTFQFHRYGQWVKVEIDDRIPMVEGDTVFCRSPTRHWWPLLLEKAYAKFYTLFQNLEDISQGEVFHDFTGRPCLTVSTDPSVASVHMSYFTEVPYWSELAHDLPHLSVTALASGAEAEGYGLLDGQHYAVMDVIVLPDAQHVSDVLVKMYNPYVEAQYSGPMNAEDASWTDELRSRLRPEENSHAFFIPANSFAGAFSELQMGYVGGLAEPSWHFNSEWAQGTNGGDTLLISWRENPLYVFTNSTDDIVQFVAMLRQPDQRHVLHTLPNQELNYPKKALSIAEANPSAEGIPTHLVTADNHHFIHRGSPVPVREVTDVLTVPPQSLCYVVGHCNNRCVSKFLFSYWFKDAADAEKLDIRRYRPAVAKHQPAIAHVDLYNRAKERVDFLVDTPTQVHAVLRQEKLFTNAQGGDVVAEDHVGVYLYDLQNKRIKGIQSAMTYRELSLVTELEKPGHYIFFCTCPRGNGNVPCRVEICAVEEAHVRITDPPDDAAALDELDMAFLESKPEGLPLSKLPLETDQQYQDDLAALRRLLAGPAPDPEEVQQLKNRLNQRVHELAKELIASERSQYLHGQDLEAMKPLLDDDEEYIGAELERYNLKQDPRNAYKVAAQEDKLRGLADGVAERVRSTDIGFIEPRPEGIAREDIPFATDPVFADMLRELARLRCHPGENASAIADVEEKMSERTRELAHAMHAAERGYLDPEPEGVPLALLPLNSDDEFCAMEDELRALHRASPADTAAIAALQAKLNARAHALAHELKVNERARFLASDGAAVDSGALDADPEFTAMEMERMRLRLEDPEKNAAAIADLEHQLNDKAAAITEGVKANERAFLEQHGVELDLLTLTLDRDSSFRRREDELRELRKDPVKNAAAIEALEEEMVQAAQQLAAALKRQLRPQYLQAEYEGRPAASLRLDDDEAFHAAEAAYLQARASGKADPETLQRLADAMNARAAELAHRANVADRSKYLPKAVRGMPLRALPLDDDEEFQRLEQARAHALCTPGKADDIAELEERLRARAEELAQARLADDRAYLDATPAGVPLELLPLNEDAVFRAKEAERAELKVNPTRDLNGLASKEAELNARAVELAQKLKEGERAGFLADSYEGIPRSELPLDTDAAFREMETDRLRRARTNPADQAADIARLEAAMKERARELAASQKASERGCLQTMDTALAGEDLQVLLDGDAEFAEMERRLRELRKNPGKNAAAIKALEEEMRKQAGALAKARLAKERQQYLQAEYEGRPAASLRLDDDEAFHAAEAAYLQARASGKADPETLQRLADAMNARAAELAHRANVADRSKYLPKAVRGVPLRALPLDDDDEFQRLEQARAHALCTPGKADDIAELEERLRARAEELAQARLAEDRAYLDATPAGVPLELLPLDEDAVFRAKEAERAELKVNPTRDLNGLASKEAELNARAVELAQKLKEGERAGFLADSYEGIPRSELPLDTDAAFREMETDRLRRARTNAADQAADIARLEAAMKERARELAASQKASERGCLQTMDTALAGEDLQVLLDGDAEFAEMERRLRELRKNPGKNAAAIKALEEEMRKQAGALAKARLAKERQQYLQAEYEGRPAASLRLDDDEAFHAAEAAYLQARASGKADPETLQRLADAMNARAAELAHRANVADRSKYLPKAVRGVPLRALPLDDDGEFQRLEQARAHALCTPGKADDIAELEERLRARADELAHARLADDRALLDQRPEGIPLACLGLDADELFRAKEEQRASLQADGQAVANRAAIAALEDSMNQQVHEMAKKLKQSHIKECVPEQVRGIPRELLPLLDDSTAAEVIATRASSDQATVSAKQGAALKARARELADATIADVRSRLDAAPLQVPLADLPLDEDEVFKALEVEAVQERQRDPQCTTATGRDAIEALNGRACELAEQQCWGEREAFMNATPEGRALRSLPLNTDPAFLAAEARHRAAAKDAAADASSLSPLKAAMETRARQLALEANKKERPTYMPASVRGVPLAALPLDDDEDFRQLERRRAMAQRDPRQLASVAGLEEALRARADEVVEGLLQNDRAFLDAKPEGVPLRQVPIDSDHAFRQLEEQRAQTRSSAAASPSAAAHVSAIEAKMNERAHELAKAVKAALRARLEQTALGVPLNELPLDSDVTFNSTEEKCRDAEVAGDAAAATAARAALNERAVELAAEMHQRDRAMLEQCPEGVPLEALPVNSDPAFLELEGDARATTNGLRVSNQAPRGSDASKLAALAAALNERARDLAHESRLAYCDAAPEGVPLASLQLATEPAFLRKEEERRQLMTRHGADAEPVLACNAELRGMANDIARKRVQGDRSYLDPEPEGVALKELPLDTDPAFHQMEVERAKLKAESGSAAATKAKALEERLNARAHELATQQKQEDLRGLDAAPSGIPLAMLQPHTDPVFAGLVDQLRELRLNGNAANADAVRRLTTEMNERCHKLARNQVAGDRAFLDEAPEGVPLALLPLDKDAAFRELETKRANLKALDPVRNATAMRELEGKLSERVHELAKGRLAQELDGIDPAPFGVPLSVLQPYQDAEFMKEVAELRRLPTTDKGDDSVAVIKAGMEKRCQAMAHDLLEKDRGYLHVNPKNVPLSLLPLASDEAFHGTEVRRALLKAENPHRNAEKIAELEGQLNLRAMELAEARRAQDLAGLDPEPNGVPLRVIDPHSDAAFAKMVDQRRALEARAGAAGGAAVPPKPSSSPELARLVAAMNDRAHELARGMLEGDRAYLDRDPEGVPLHELPLDSDVIFRDLEVERASAKVTDPKRNVAKIKELELKLNDRAHELAKLQKAEDLHGVNPAPRGVPLELLKPHDDPLFAEQVQQMRGMKRNPPRDINEKARHLDDMNSRAHELADKVLVRDYLDPSPEGVPLAELPLDSDAKFHDMEVERATLKLSDPRRQADRIASLSAALNQRAAELAKRQRVADLASVEEAPHGLAKELLGLHTDVEGARLIDDLRQLRKAPPNTSDALPRKESELNERAFAVANALLAGDRANYLDPRPHNIPLEDLPLDKDELFHTLEVERATLRATDPVRNATAIRNTEGMLNDRAYQLAEIVMDEDLAHFPPNYCGIRTKDLKPHSDRLFSEAAEKRRHRVREPSVTFKEDLEQIMDDRLNELAREQKEGDLYFMNPAPEGVLLADLPLATDDTFNQLRYKRQQLREADPMANRGAITGLEDEMNHRATMLAREVLSSDFDGVDKLPLGIPLDLLKPREDSEVARLIPELRRAKRSTQLRSKAAELQARLSERVHALAAVALEEGREDYLDANPEGVPLELLPLRTDEAFHDGEVERAILRLQDPARNGGVMAQLEQRLNLRAHELALAQKKEDLAGLEPAPRDVPLEVLRPHDDPKLSVLIKDVRLLKTEPSRNADKIRWQRQQMDERAMELATLALNGDRGYLAEEPLGVPLAVLPLDADATFHDTEVARAVAKRQLHPDKHAVARLEHDLNARAAELAAQQLRGDLEGLEPAPLGVPLTLLKPHSSPAFAELLPELRRLAKDATRNAARLKQVRGMANERNFELAEDFLAQDRPTYLDTEPEGLPLALLPLTADEEFKGLENKRLHLMAKQAAGEPVSGTEKAALEKRLNDRAHEVAIDQLRKDRAYLDPFPEGVPLAILPLDTDPAFRRLEAARAAAKGRHAKTQAGDLEDQLNARAHELAIEQKAEDLRGLEQSPRDIPLALLNPHQDAQFGQLVDELRQLKAAAGDHHKPIKDTQEHMNQRSRALADEAMKADRRYLAPRPEGVPLSRLPLDTDAAFHALEVERAKLKLTDPKKQQRRIAELEDQLCSRAEELAKAVKAVDLRPLTQAPRGIPVELLGLHNDAKFGALLSEMEQLPAHRSSDTVAPLISSMNECAVAAADRMLRGDRGYLDREPEGVPLAQLPLDDDVPFHEMEVERAVLKAQDPVKNASTISDLEDQLNARAHQLACAELADDRGYLNPKPEGVPIEELPLDTDVKFHSMEVERSKLKARKGEGSAARVAELEGRLNDRAVSLAKKQLEEDLQGLDREPHGYPLKYLRPHSDDAFAALVLPLRRAKTETPVEARKIREAQTALNARAHALARERIVADRACLDQEPEGVPLVLLPLEDDARFSTAEKELRMLKTADRLNPRAIADMEGKMNDRAHVLAKEYLAHSRGFLDQEPEGVPLSDIPLDDDGEFRTRERERLQLLAHGAAPMSSQLRAAEERLNDRAHTLAAEEKTRCREFLRATSSDIPKSLLALDADKVFVAKEKELRRMVQHADMGHTGNSVADLCRELQARADEVGEAQLKGERDKYLDVQPEGVDLCDIPLDADSAFHVMEVERAVLLAQDPAGNRGVAAQLGAQLNARTHELAQQIVANDRGYLPEEAHGIPIAELPLDMDSKFKKLERQRRAHKRSPNMKKEVAADEEELRNRASELAREVIAQDLEPLKATYRGIPKEELNLHADPGFRELAKKRRKQRGKGRVEATEMAALEDEMERRVCEIADDVIENERAFLDPTPEGMLLVDVPLDDDPPFQRLEQEYRRRSKDPRSARQNRDVLRELVEEMNLRSHTLARMEFAKQRGFMDPEPEGVPLAELGLDEDPEFKEAEIARYRTNRMEAPVLATVTEAESRMRRRAYELARAMLAADRAFLDPEPEGVALEVLPLDSDKEFGDLARERRRRKKALKAGMGEAEVRAVEEKMNVRAHEMAKEFLEVERSFLQREPEGVPLADLPLNSDAPFRAMEKERLWLKRDPLGNAAAIAAKQADLEDRARVVAKEMLRKERAFLEPEPLGVPLEELPLNYDELLNPVERRRRALRLDPKRNHESIRACEEQMADLVAQIASNFVDKERAFLDQSPEGVPLRYLPLSSDREFHEKELQRRRLRQRPEKNHAEIAETERRMNDRVHALAKDLVLKGRAFLHPEPCGVPIAEVPLNGDEHFRKMEEQRRALKEAGRSAASVKAIEERLNERAEALAQELLDTERAFMDRAPLGIPLGDLPLNSDRRMREIERTRRQLRRTDPDGAAHNIAVLEAGMDARAYELADQLLSSDRGFLEQEPCGVPLADLPLHTDSDFHETELARFRAKKRGSADVAGMERKMNDRVQELAAVFIKQERAYLDQEPQGIPLSRLPLDTDAPFHSMELERRRLKRSGENASQVLELEHLLNRRAHQLAMEIRGWQDAEFHEANAHVAEQWVRVCDLYPERRYEPLEPVAPALDDAVSAPQDIGYLVPFLAALSRHPILLQRLMATKESPVNAPYTFIFFDPHSNPVYVDVDDRVPCTGAGEPKFVQSPYHLWYPLLLEKAYAKFVGGYEQLDNCTSLETLRDLTGRPVTHTPFDPKLAEAANLGDYTSVEFWAGVAEDLARGDVVVCTSNTEVPDGIHPLCSYALVGVVITLDGSTNPSDVVIKLENSYRGDEPVYTGPLCQTDVNWNLALQRICQYDPSRDDILYLPLPTFLRNFSSLQTCHINCGDRLTATGTWDSRTSGGNPKFTSFRNNPVYVLHNSSSRPATVLAELRHEAPQFVDPEGLSHYPQSGIVLMEPTSSTAPPTPLITNSTARFLQKGVMLDSREVCSLMEVPASSSCLLIPYTSRVGQQGSFYLSVYPGFAKVSLTPLQYCGLSREPKSASVTLRPGEEGQRIDFTVSTPCDVHVLLRQEKISDRQAASWGDVIADDDVVMVAFNDQAMKLTSSGDATNAREHSLVFKADKPGYYSLLVTSPNRPVSGDNPCTVSIYTPKRVLVKFVPPPVGARPLQQSRFPTLPRKGARPPAGGSGAAGAAAGRRARGAATASRPSKQRQRDESLPPIRNGGAVTLTPRSRSNAESSSYSY